MKTWVYVLIFIWLIVLSYQLWSVNDRTSKLPSTTDVTNTILDLQQQWKQVEDYQNTAKTYRILAEECGDPNLADYYSAKAEEYEVKAERIIDARVQQAESKMEGVQTR